MLHTLDWGLFTAIAFGNRRIGQEDRFNCTRRALPHGHLAAVLGTLRALGMARILDRKGGWMRDLATGAMLSCRLF